MENGYDKAQVEAYITHISETYKKMHAGYQQIEGNCAELTAQKESLTDQLKAQSEKIAELQARSAGDGLSADAALIAKVMIDARKTAEEVTANARFEADDIISGAKSEAEKIVYESKASIDSADLKKNEIIKTIEVIRYKVQEILDEING